MVMFTRGLTWVAGNPRKTPTPDVKKLQPQPGIAVVFTGWSSNPCASSLESYRMNLGRTASDLKVCRRN